MPQIIANSPKDYPEFKERLPAQKSTCYVTGATIYISINSDFGKATIREKEIQDPFPKQLESNGFGGLKEGSLNKPVYWP